MWNLDILYLLPSVLHRWNAARTYAIDSIIFLSTVLVCTVYGGKNLPPIAASVLFC
jgi:hypothetical protein